MIIYVDKDYKCHTEPAEGLRGFELPFFEGKCKSFVEGYRYLPEGETWTREDGEVFSGEMISPCEDFKVLHSAQQLFESLLPQLEKLDAIGECLDGLSYSPSLEHLLDFIHTIRELLED